MRTPSRGTAAALIVVSVLYVLLGVGYHRGAVACYDSRHSIDKEPMVGGRAFGLVIDVLLWPMWQAFTAITPDLSCEPRPVGQ
jgi:hypothetical protein